MGYSVASLTTAYNAERVIARQMTALLGQTRPLQEIIVVDNASTDGTRALLADRYPQVTVLPMPENLGAAGAWAAGLSYAALKKRHDWVWTFDDDTMPQPDALAALLSGTADLEREHPEVGMAAALSFSREGDRYGPVLWRNGFVKPTPLTMRQEAWFADLVIASGCMVRREVVERVGLPRADFFMDVFDFEYCLRIRSAGYKIAAISGARLVHEIGQSRRIRLPGYRRLWMCQAPWREYYISRNLSYLAWSLYPNRQTQRYVARYLAIHAVQILLFGAHRPACLLKMGQGLSDGLRGVLGIRFRPEGIAGDNRATPAGKAAAEGRA
jgi:rhamnopyranosyl-N-acetylglucosaminyl-diphospho-decaprenol beta-1,3/1,4-galactofuranosyltransferase